MSNCPPYPFLVLLPSHMDTTALFWPAAVLRCIERSWALSSRFSQAPNPGSFWDRPYLRSLMACFSPLPLPPCSLYPCSTASNSNRSTPACSPILRKRSRSPTPQSADGDAMVEKGSDHSSDKSPSTPEQGVQRSCSSQSGRSAGKNSKVSRPICWPRGAGGIGYREGDHPFLEGP